MVNVHGSAPPLTAEAASLIEKETPALLSQIRGVQRSAPPLTAEAASLIEKETPALRSHIRGLRTKKGLKTRNRR